MKNVFYFYLKSNELFGQLNTLKERKNDLGLVIDVGMIYKTLEINQRPLQNILESWT